MLKRALWFTVFLSVTQAVATEFRVNHVISTDPKDYQFQSFKLSLDPAGQIPIEVRVPGLPSNQPFLVRSQLQTQFCDKVDQRLGSVTFLDCLIPNYEQTGFSSKLGQPLLKVDYATKNGVNPIGRILLIGAVHGDELSSASMVFKWARLLNRYHSGEFVWRVVPVMNPDGLFRPNPSRTNANGIDLNRNMPTPNWRNTALEYWHSKAKESPRKYPGRYPGSEPETQWLMYAVQSFEPDVIIAVHAPHNLVDYDAPDRDNGPEKLGNLRKGALGTFPGSLGSYAGEKRGIPVVTIELPNSNIAVSEAEYKQIWLDLLAWLGDQLKTEKNRFSSAPLGGVSRSAQSAE